MALDNESFNKQLYDLLKTRGYKPVSKNARNQDVSASQEADVMEFVFTKDGESYGKAWVTIDNASSVVLYYDNEIEDSPEGRTPGVDYDDSWSGFKKHLSNWAQRKQLDFELANKDRLSDDMRQREYVKMKEKVNEGYYPMGKQASYNDSVPTVKIILQHTRQIQEGEQRYRNIAKIFLENTEGERILAPTTRPGIAQVYARHLAEGGVPNDERWNHIKGLCEEYNKMAGFVRATRNNQFNESAQALVNEGVSHYQSLRETLSKMRGHRGYNAYFESYTPTLMETDGDESLNELFVQETLDPRIESVMPILSRLRKNLGEMSEVKALESWADNIISEKMDSTTKSLAVPADEMLDEAPGAETLAHNQSTEKSNLAAFDLDEEADEGRPYICVHAKKGKFECHANSSYEAAKKAAQKWGLKSTAGIDAHLADVKHSTASLGEAELSQEEKLKDALKKIEAKIAAEKNPQQQTILRHKKEDIESALKQLQNQPKPTAKPSSNNPLSRLRGDVADAEKSSSTTDPNFWASLAKLAVGLGEDNGEELDEGMMKHKMHADAEKMSLEQFCDKYGDEDWIKEFWRDSNGVEDDEKLAEGILDKIKGAIGLGPKKGSERWIRVELPAIEKPNQVKDKLIGLGLKSIEHDRNSSGPTNTYYAKTDISDNAHIRNEIKKLYSSVNPQNIFVGNSTGPSDQTVAQPASTAPATNTAPADQPATGPDLRVDRGRLPSGGQGTSNRPSSTGGRLAMPGEPKGVYAGDDRSSFRGDGSFRYESAEQGVAEDLDANQKRVGQLGPTEKVGPKGAVGKLVGASESIERDPLDDIKRLLGN